MKIVSFNLNGINASLRKGLLEFIQSNNADVYCFQEIKADLTKIPKEIMSIPNYHVYPFPAERKGYSGTLILSKTKPLSVKNGIGVKEYDSEGRTITVEFDNFFLVNTYYLNSKSDLSRLNMKQVFNNTLLKHYKSLEEKKPVVATGDFNVAHKEIDLKNPKPNRGNAGFTDEERSDFDNLIENGFIDTFRMFNQEPDQYTWWSYRFSARDRNIGWRIDYFVVSAILKDRIKNSKILSDVLGSDHCPIELEIE